MMYFTSDFHFGHQNIIRHDKRPFTSIDEMDQAIIYNWNTYVTDKDDIYYLGDWTYRCEENDPPNTAEGYLKLLAGRIHIIFGNHDRRYARKIADKFRSHADLRELKYEHQKITLCHYAMRTWPSSHHGSWMLHGHSHCNLPAIGKTLDVGVMGKKWDPNVCWLWTFPEIKEYMDGRPDTYHHTESE